MKVSLFTSDIFDFVWPLGDSLPESEKITLKCRKLSHASKVGIEDKLAVMRPEAMMRGQKKSEVEQKPMVFTLALGTVKSDKIKATVTGWENVLDESEDPIRFTIGGLQELISSNCGLNPDDHGLLETDLLERIDSVNSFADKQQIGTVDVKK